MSDGIDQHPPLVRSGLVLRLRGAQPDSTLDGGLQFADGNVQVELLVLRTFRPGGRNIAVDAHQCEHGACAGECNDAAVRSGECFLKAQQARVEGCELVGVRAVERDGCQLSYAFCHDDKLAGWVREILARVGAALRRGIRRRLR